MTIELILDQCLEDVRQRRATVADCLARFPEYAQELEPLLEAAIALEEMADVSPSAEFKQSLRERLMRLPSPGEAHSPSDTRQNLSSPASSVSDGAADPQDDKPATLPLSPHTKHKS